MKNKLKLLISVLLLAACTGKKQVNEIPPDLNSKPKTVEVRIGDGYTLNPATGDSIEPLINSSGDTLKTGIPIPARGKVIYLDSMPKPRSFNVPPIEQFTQINAHPNVHQIPDELSVIPVNKDSLTIILLEEIGSNDTTHYLVNSSGDTVKTGVPIRAQGKSVAIKYPQPISALKPIFKDAAKSNLQNLDVDQGMASSYIISILEDKRGNLWFGTWGSGVSRYDGTNFTHFTEKEGLSDDQVLCMAEDNSGNIWFGTWSGGISRYDGQSFTHFTEKEGLSNNTLWAIFKDTRGNLWFGTQNGVSQYDGQSFTHFTKKEGLSNYAVWAITEDKYGNLWFGTKGDGAIRYDGNRVDAINNGQAMTEEDRQDLKFIDEKLVKSFTHFTNADGLPNNYVKSILEDRKGNLWFGTYGEGVCRYNGQSMQHGQTSFMFFTEKEGLSNNFISSIIEDNSGNLWFGTHNEGVSRYDGNRVDAINNGQAFTLGDRQDLKTVNGQLVKTFTNFTKEEGFSSNHVTSIIEDKSGKLWFGSNGGGVSRYDKHSFRHFTENEGLTYVGVESIMEDKNHNLWFATTSGLNRYDGQNITRFTEKEGLSNNHVTSIAEDKIGNLWIGTFGTGLICYDGIRVDAINNGQTMTERDRRDLKMKDGKLVKTFTYFTEKEGLSSNYIHHIAEDKKGNLWLGTDDIGVICFDGNRVDAINSGQEMTEQDRNELKIIDGKPVKTFTSFTESEGFSNLSVHSIVEDKIGNLWFGIDGGGVIRYDRKSLPSGEASFTHFTEKEGLANNSATFLRDDRRGNMWFSNWGFGLSRYDGNRVDAINEGKEVTEADRQELKMVNEKFVKSFTYYTKKEGLSNNIVRSIIEDKSGNLWFSTDEGLTNMVYERDSSNTKYAENSRNVKLLRFLKNDGLKGTDFISNSVWLDSKNRMWWGGGKGLVMLDMNNYHYSQKPPIVSLRHLDINEQYLDYRNLKDSTDSYRENGILFSKVSNFENYPLNLELPYHKNHLTFYFSAIDWSAPHKIQYSYLLEGLNSQWSLPSAEPKADYRNLSYGTYTFKLRAIGESGDWSDAFEYTFTIAPPWWHTWWAYVIYIVSFLLALGIFSKWRERKLLAENEKLEQIVEDRTGELVQKNILVESEKLKAEKQKAEDEKQRQRSDDLLLNILPEEIAEELKTNGSAEAKQFDEVSVLFTDFVNFTQTSAVLSPHVLVAELNECFSAFDSIIEKYGLEKIKTIGDAYLAVCGLPNQQKHHAEKTAQAALEISQFMADRKKKEKTFDIRLGINSGPVVAGIVGVKKFQYDIWGDTVNTAARMESAGAVGKVNISQATHALLQNNPNFTFESRGKIAAKGKGELEMWFVSHKSLLD